MTHSTTRQIPEVKNCTKCKQEKPLQEFSRRSDRPGGYRNQCKACRNAANPERVAEQKRAYRSANLERERARGRAWYAANRERAKAYSRSYYAANREDCAERTRAWWEANPGKVAEYSVRKREKHPEHYRARMAVREAVRLDVFPPVSALVCEHCQEAQADHYHHHLGYEEEHWLDVMAVCVPCHIELHRKGNVDSASAKYRAAYDRLRN